MTEGPAREVRIAKARKPTGKKAESHKEAAMRRDEGKRTEREERARGE